MMKKYLALILLVTTLMVTPLFAEARTVQVNIEGQEFKPEALQVWPGDKLNICNQSEYRRQPYCKDKYNSFGQRKPDNLLMLKKGECREVQIQNPTTRPLKVTIRDAVAGKAKLKLHVWQQGADLPAAGR